MQVNYEKILLNSDLKSVCDNMGSITGMQSQEIILKPYLRNTIILPFLASVLGFVWGNHIVCKPGLIHAELARKKKRNHNSHTP